MPTPEQAIAQLESTVAALEAAGGNEALVATVRAQLEQARRALAEGRPIDLAQQNPSSASLTASQLKRSAVRRPPELDLSAALPYKSEGRL